MMGSLQGSEHVGQRNDVCARSVERQTSDDVSVEQLTECVLAARSVVVLAVGERVAFIGFDNGLQDSGMDTGGVVTGKRAMRGCWHGRGLFG